MNPEQHAAEYLQKYGMIPGPDFIPANVIDKAAKLLTDNFDEDIFDEWIGI